MKKLLAFIAALLVLGCFVYADVSVKDLGGGNVEVTFFYGNPRATEVVIAGSWTDWQNGALPMTKVEKGWEYKVTVPADTVMKYKFISDGNWTFDLKSPDSVDDGFGGKNGLVEVATLVAAAKGSSAAPAPKSGIKFQTWSMLGTQAKFDTVELKKASGVTKDDSGIDSVGLGLKSYWKFSGDAVPGVPVYVEIALAENDGFANIYQEGAYVKGVKADPTVDWEDGLKNLGVDLLFDPIYFLDGQAEAKTYLGHFKTGINTKYVEWVTGYKYAKLPPHTNVSWITVDKEWEAGYSSVGGFNQFALAPALSESIANATGVKANLVVAPNRSADRKGTQYGMYTYANAEFAGQYVDFQYNGAYGDTYDTIFGHIYESDFILGYKGLFGPVTVKANGLYNMYGDGDLSVENHVNIVRNKYVPGSSDVGAVDPEADTIANIAGNLQLVYSDDIATVTLGGRVRGAQANMMYVEEGADDHTNISDQLGARNSQRYWLNATVKASDVLSVGLNPYVQMALDQDSKVLPYNDKANMLVYGKPSFTLDLENVTGVKSSIDAYGVVKYCTSSKDKFARGSAENAFVFNEAGLKYSMESINDTVKGIEVLYGFDNDASNAAFHTLLATVKLPASVNVQAGGGFRAANKDVKLVSGTEGAFYLGVNKKLSILQAPTVYAQGVYNMDPFKGFGDGQENYNLDGYTLDSGVDNYSGAAALRVAIRWEL